MVTVLKVPVSKDRLRAMPEDERALLILLGYVANKISLLSKLVIFSSNKTPDGVEHALCAAQTQMLARLAIRGDPPRRRQCRSRLADKLIGLVEQPVRHALKREVCGGALLLVVEGRRGLAFVEDRRLSSSTRK